MVGTFDRGLCPWASGASTRGVVPLTGARVSDEAPRSRAAARAVRRLRRLAAQQHAVVNLVSALSVLVLLLRQPGYSVPLARVQLSQFAAMNLIYSFVPVPVIPLTLLAASE